MPSARIWAHLEVEMTPQDIEAIFTRSDGRFAFARWGRPIAPVVFGVDDATLAVVKGAVEATCQLVRQPIVETDPELGSNLMMFFFSGMGRTGGGARPGPVGPGYGAFGGEVTGCWCQPIPVVSVRCRRSDQGLFRVSANG